MENFSVLLLSLLYEKVLKIMFQKMVGLKLTDDTWQNATFLQILHIQIARTVLSECSLVVSTLSCWVFFTIQFTQSLEKTFLSVYKCHNI